MRVKVTNITLEKLKPGALEIVDQESGLRIKRRETGKISLSWRFRRPVTGKGAKLHVGTWVALAEEDEAPVLGGHVTLAGARLLVARAKVALSKGTDPGKAYLADKKRKKASDKLDAATTVPEVAKAFVRHCRALGHRRFRNSAGTLGLRLSKTGEPLGDYKPGSPCDLWRDTPLRELTKRQVLALCDEYVQAGHGPAGLSRFKVVRRMCRWAVSRDLIEKSPLDHVQPPWRTHSRDRYLSDVETCALLRACRRPEAGLMGKLVLFLTHVGCRRDEARGMRRGEVEGNTWVIPRERMKTKTAHTVILSRQALAILESVERVGDGDLVFTANGRQKLGGMARHKKVIDELMRAELKKLGAQFQPWVLHDLRRCLAVQCQRLGVEFPTIERMLAHNRGISRSGIAFVYQRYDHGIERAAAWQKLADRLDDIARGKVETGRVIPMERKTA